MLGKSKHFSLSKSPLLNVIHTGNSVTSQSSVTPQIPLHSPKMEGCDEGWYSLICGESMGDSAVFCHTNTWGYMEGRWRKCWTRVTEQRNAKSETGVWEKNGLEWNREKKSILCYKGTKYLKFLTKHSFKFSQKGQCKWRKQRPWSVQEGC